MRIWNSTRIWRRPSLMNFEASAEVLELVQVVRVAHLCKEDRLTRWLWKITSRELTMWRTTVKKVESPFIRFIRRRSRKFQEIMLVRPVLLFSRNRRHPLRNQQSRTCHRISVTSQPLSRCQKSITAGSTALDVTQRRSQYSGESGSFRVQRAGQQAEPELEE